MSSQPTAYPYPSIVTANIAGTLTSNSFVKVIMPFAGRVSAARGVLGTAATGSAMAVSVIKGASTSVATFSFAVAETTATATLNAAEANVKFAAGDVLTIDVGAGDSGDTATDLSVTLVVDQYNLDGDGTNEYTLTYRRGGHDGGVLTAANVNTYQENGTTTTGVATPKTV